MKIMNGKRIAMKLAHTFTALVSCVFVAGITDSTKWMTLTLALAIVYVTLVWDD